VKIKQWDEISEFECVKIAENFSKRLNSQESFLEFDNKSLFDFKAMESFQSLIQSNQKLFDRMLQWFFF
jgi:hypothetical protein